MNKKLLQKVIDALNQKSPDLSYIRGMLETMMEMQDGLSFTNGTHNSNSKLYSNDNIPVVEVENSLSPAENAALIAEKGFIKGTKPGVTEIAPIISNGK